MQFFFATPKHLHRVHSHFFMVVLGVAEGGFLFAHSHVSSVSIEVGTGFCPIWGIWRGAGTPATSQMRCWLLRRHKLHIPRPAASGRSRPFRCASSQNRNRVAGLRFCVFCARRRNVGFSCCAAHTPRSLPGKPHTAATRGSRRRTVPAVEGCKDANRSRRYPLTLLLRQAPEPLVGAALRKNAEISLCDFQRPL